MEEVIGGGIGYQVIVDNIEQGSLDLWINCIIDVAVIIRKVDFIIDLRCKIAGVVTKVINMVKPSDGICLIALQIFILYKENKNLLP